VLTDNIGEANFTALKGEITVNQKRYIMQRVFVLDKNRQALTPCHPAGSYDAVNMDGGGTSTMAMSTNLRPMIINNPCNWITPPFFERSGGNHLGIGLKD